MPWRARRSASRRRTMAAWAPSMPRHAPAPAASAARRPATRARALPAVLDVCLHRQLPLCLHMQRSLAAEEAQMGLDGIHHVTAITGDAQRAVDFWVPGPGPAAGEDHRQLRRAGHVPPLLRRRDRQPGQHPDLLRDPGRPRGARGRGHGPPDRLAGALGRRPSTRGRRGWETPAGRSSSRRRAGVVRPRGPGDRARGPRSRRRRRRAPRWAPDIPAEHALTGIAGVRAHSRGARGHGSLLVDALGFAATAPGAS